MAQQATMLYQALQQAGLGRWISAGIAMGKLWLNQEKYGDFMGFSWLMVDKLVNSKNYGLLVGGFKHFFIFHNIWG